MKNKAIKTISALVILLFVFILPTCVFSTSDTDEQLEVSVEYGYNGYAKYGKQVPAICTIKNNGSGFNGTLSFNFELRNGNQRVIQKQFSVSSNSTTKVIVALPQIESYTDVLIKIYGEDESESLYIQEDASLNRNTDDIYVGVFSKDISLMEYWGKMTLNSDFSENNRGFRVINMANYTIFDTVDSLESLNVIVLGDYNIGSMSEQQQQSLYQWVYNGGVLITGPASNYESLWDTFGVEPATVAKTVEKDTNLGLSDYTYQQLTAKLSTEKLPPNPTDEERENYNKYSLEYEIKTETFDGENVSLKMDLLNNDSDDFIVGDWYQYAYVGQGNVTSTTMKLDSDTFSSWEGNVAAMSYMLENTLGNIQRRNMTDLYSSENEFVNAEQSLPNGLGMKMPNLVVVGIILVVYAIICGPILYFILKLKDKRHYIWVGVTVLSVTCVLVIFATTSDSRKKDTFINYAVHLDYDEDSIYEEIDCNVTMPNRGTSTIEIPSMYRTKVLYENMERTEVYWVASNNLLSEDSYDFSMTYGSVDTKLEFNNKAPFSDHLFKSTREMYSTELLDVTLSYEDDHYVGSISNNTGFSMKNTGIIVGETIILTGNISNGQSKIIEDHMIYDLRDFNSDTFCSAIQVLLTVDNNENMITEQPNTYSEGNMALVNAQMQLYSQYTYNANETTPLVFVGFTEEYKPEALRNTQYDTKGVTMVTSSIELNVTDEEGNVYIPDAFCYYQDKHDGELSNTFYSVMEGTIRLPVNMEVTDISAVADSGVEIFLYNYVYEEYTALDMLKDADESQWAQYVNHGEIAIEIKSNKVDNYNPIKVPSVSIKGVSLDAVH